MFRFTLCRVLMVCLSFVSVFIPCATGQMDTATLSGHVIDSSGLSITGAQVELVDIDRDTHSTTRTNSAGVYNFPNVRPGRYRLQVAATGFKTVNVTSLAINIQDSLEQNFKLAVGSILESITVEASSTPIDISGTVGTVVDQKLIHELPLQGRSFQTLFQLTPGVVIAAGNYDNPGQFSVNGERTSANYFIVDGASANAGIQSGSGPSQSLAGSLPAFGVTGGTNNLVSTDAVQEFAIRTSSFAAEYGRTPGAQVSIVTKSGTNEFHGDLFDYLRNDVLDANDWFANHNGLKRPELRQNDFGGVVGGPIFRNRTFFFLSYEGLRLRQPTTDLTDVPSVAARQAAPAAIQAFFNMFPLPNGPDEGNGLAPANYAFSNPTTLDATSVRLDHHFSQNLAVFARYNYSPSISSIRGGVVSLNTIIDDTASVQTLTLGLMHLVLPRLTNDVRFNWTRAIGGTRLRQDDFGGATPLSADVVKSVFPTPFTPSDSSFNFFLSLEGLNVNTVAGRNAQNTQRQLNAVDNVSLQAGSHLLKFGVDYRRLTPHVGPPVYLQQVAFSDVATAITAVPSFVFISRASPVDATFNNYSIYVQDTWAATPRFTLTYGLRWDYNPTPTFLGEGGLHPIVVNDVSNIATITAAPYGSPFYRATRNNFAPRIGLAYQFDTTPGRETVLRAGTGIFYDLGTGTIGNSTIGAPFQAFNIPAAATFPLPPADAAPPPLTTTPPFEAIVVGFPTRLRLPYSYHWNVSIQQSLGRDQSLTVGYVGSAGHSLLRISDYQGSALSSDIFYTDNSGYSHYNALQTQYRRRTAKGLDLLASYTYGHALDNGSSEVAFNGIPGKFIDPRNNYSRADFDIRHTATVGLSYDLPHPSGSRLAAALLGGWGIDPVFTLRTAPPGQRLCRPPSRLRLLPIQARSRSRRAALRGRFRSARRSAHQCQRLLRAPRGPAGNTLTKCSSSLLGRSVRPCAAAALYAD